MKNLYFYLILFCLAINIMAQDKVNVLIPYTDTEPTIDGVIDGLWDQVPAEFIENKFQDEQPTVTAYWKALWDNTALYVLVSVEDDDHWPSWVSGGDWWLYDQTEVYLDVNEELNDGSGPGDKGTGHYQAQPNFYDGGSGVMGDLVVSNYRPGGLYCYVLTGENYVFEYALDYTSFVNKDQVTLSVSDFMTLDSIGFDVTIIDQDEGVTTSRQRAVWQNVGDKDESYLNMDDAGTITLVDELQSSIYSQKITPLSVYPNPVSDYLLINAEFDKLIITNILGIEVSTIETSEKNITMEFLPAGFYIIQVFNKENPIGTTKIYKN